jgi:drug/metabolite transporter (DMT)-like permease
MTPVSLHEQNPLRGILLILIAILLFTIRSALVKVAREVVPPGEAVFYRAFFAIPPILIWAAWRGRITDALRVRDRLAHVTRGLVGVGAVSLGFTALGLLPLP